jgi:FtsH-binding integral membrane protein
LSSISDHKKPKMWIFISGDLIIPRDALNWTQLQFQNNPIVKLHTRQSWLLKAILLLNVLFLSQTTPNTSCPFPLIFFPNFALCTKCYLFLLFIDYLPTEYKLHEDRNFCNCFVHCTVNVFWTRWMSRSWHNY